MKKGILLILCICVLCGCNSHLSMANIESEVKNILTKEANSNKIANTNREKRYYHYYLPKEMGRINGSNVGEVFKKDGFKIVMNFNTAPFIIDAFYSNANYKQSLNVDNENYTEEHLMKLLKEGKYEDKKPNDVSKQLNVKKEIDIDAKKIKIKKQKDDIVSFSGYYKNTNHLYFPYTLKIKKMEKNCYLYLDGRIVNFTTYVPSVEVDNILHSMIHIMKSINYDQEAIINDFARAYSLNEVQDNYNKNKEYILQNIPGEGYLDELIKESEGDK